MLLGGPRREQASREGYLQDSGNGQHGDGGDGLELHFGRSRFCKRIAKIDGIGKGVEGDSCCRSQKRKKGFLEK